MTFASVRWSFFATALRLPKNFSGDRSIARTIVGLIEPFRTKPQRRPVEDERRAGHRNEGLCNMPPPGLDCRGFHFSNGFFFPIYGIAYLIYGTAYLLLTAVDHLRKVLTRLSDLCMD